MFRLSKKFIRLVMALIVVGLSFYLGIRFYFVSHYSQNNLFTSSPVKEFKPQLENSVKKDLKIQTGEKDFVVRSDEIKSWIEPYYRNYSGKEDLRVSRSKITNYLESIAPLLNIEPVNAKFVINNDGRAETFRPATDGQKLKTEESTALVSFAIFKGADSVSLAFDQIEPEITLDKINNLGITTLLGTGESDYGNSTSSRIHNIKIGLSRFNGIILKPGEEFSFNSYLGNIDEQNGYQSELVIKGGRLIYEYGGGLCQVATTVFRSAIMSGLDITERKPHSFPVQYYDPQGFDATIYPGVVDLKFKNNTEGNILIQTKLIGSKLVVEIYGSQTDKKVVMDGPIQYDKKPNGSMKAYFVRKIFNGDKLENEERFDSKYNSPPPRERNPLE